MRSTSAFLSMVFALLGACGSEEAAPTPPPPPPPDPAAELARAGDDPEALCRFVASHAGAPTATEATARIAALRATDRARFESEAELRTLEPDLRAALAATFDAPPCETQLGLSVRLEQEDGSEWRPITPVPSAEEPAAPAAAPALRASVTTAVRDQLTALLGPTARIAEGAGPISISIALRRVPTGTVSNASGVEYPTFDLRPVVTLGGAALGAPRTITLPDSRPMELMILRFISRPVAEATEEILRQHGTTVPAHVVRTLHLREIDAALAALPRVLNVEGTIRADGCAGRIEFPACTLTIDPSGRSLHASVLERDYDVFAGTSPGSLVATGSAVVEGTCPGSRVAETWELNETAPGVYGGVFTTSWALPPDCARCGVSVTLRGTPAAP